MAPVDFYNKNPDELTAQELSFIHLDTSSGIYLLKECKTRSMLSFIMEGIQMAMVYDRTKNIMPVMSLMCILDQLGICYDRKDKSQPRFNNGIKRALYYFGEFNENDNIIKVLYALRNGLLHNVSLVSKNPFDPSENYYFRYDYTINDIFKEADTEWLGDYSTLDTEKNVTLINPSKLKTLVDNCLDTANKANDTAQLQIRLAGGIIELFYSYLRTIPK